MIFEKKMKNEKKKSSRLARNGIPLSTLPFPPSRARATFFLRDPGPRETQCAAGTFFFFFFFFFFARFSMSERRHISDGDEERKDEERERELCESRELACRLCP